MILLQELATSLGVPESYCRFLAETLPGLRDLPTHPIPPFVVIVTAAACRMNRYLNQAQQDGVLWICGHMSMDSKLARAAEEAEAHAHRVIDLGREDEPPLREHQLHVLDTHLVTWTGQNEFYDMRDKTRRAIGQGTAAVESWCLHLESCYLYLRRRHLQSDYSQR